GPGEKIQPTFKYTGITYQKSGGLVVCGSNNLACGANPDEYYCKNIPHPEIDNRGNIGSKDQCQDPVGLGADNFTIAEPSCNGNSQPVDILSYVGACKSGECSKSKASVLTRTDSYVNVVNNQVVWTDANNFRLKTNDKEIKYTVRGGSVYMTEDHTWENEQKCDNGNPAFQRPYTVSNGVRTEGVALYKPEMRCGDTVSGKTALEAFDATTGNACTNGIATNSQSQLLDYSVRLIYQGRAVCGGESKNIVAFQNTAGPGTGEVYIYSQGKGLTAWYQGMDFTKGTNNPKNWGASTDVCSGTFSSVPACAIQSKPQTTGQAPIYGAVDFGCKGDKGITCVLETQIAKLFGRVFFANQKTVKTYDLTKYANWLMGAKDYFIAAGLKKEEKLITKPFLGYASGTLGVDSDEPKPNCHEVKQGVINFLLPKWNEIVGLSAIFNAIDGPFGARSDLNVRRDFSPLFLTERDNRRCADQSPFEPVKEISLTSVNEHEYEPDPSEFPVYKSAVRMGVALIDKINAIIARFGFCAGDGCNASGAFKWIAYFDILNPHSEATMKNFAVSKNNEEKGWGFDFVPSRLKKIKYTNAGTLANEIEHPDLGNQEPAYVDLPFEGVGTFPIMADAVLCSVTPSEFHSQSNINCDNLISTGPDDDIAPGRSLSGGTDPGFSGASLGSDYSKITNGKIPACVLEAVKYIETGTNTNFSGVCTVNACSAAGPFQVTTGVDNTGDTKCRMCGGNDPKSSWINGQRDCPDGWPGNWPKVPTDPNPCQDISNAANRAVEMLQEKARIRCETLDNRPATEQREAIITAGDSYYGSSEDIPRLGGCSYGEFVYKHCDGLYDCRSPNIDLGKKYEQCQQQQNL
ncbi:MAG: hypothetical protein AAB481_04755, partial [Patescibacteria group bacterium]